MQARQRNVSRIAKYIVGLHEKNNKRVCKARDQSLVGACRAENLRKIITYVLGVLIPKRLCNFAELAGLTNTAHTIMIGMWSLYANMRQQLNCP